ncbi:Crp/Fnr family transcriptional regulator [Winogradskyella sp. UBA3174]|uniref:Crp/Fnr family transcriptional regulator n=1 Tax=Winogradskyella sp. UBA3174 TaxID=1947785 RepID=UPI0025F4A63C|nr:Crp/Fnr family transcriptional regulator [Winogradskyella sp. UBA3174]|tara:strand:- start:1636 stop:2217 length:582 start_codon:yes stop_codon:yes gene_type:complete
MNELKHYFNAISKLNESTWDRIVPYFKEERLQKNEYFAKENKTAHQIAFLKTGVVRAYFINKEGKDYNKQFFVGQSIIGAYSSLLTGKTNLIAQQALTDCVIYTCNYAALTTLYNECPDLERFARKIAEYYFLEKEKKEIEIVLLDASQRYVLFKKEFPTLEQLITQFHIASYLGISATQLSRIRKQFASKKS